MVRVKSYKGCVAFYKQNLQNNIQPHILAKHNFVQLVGHLSLNRRLWVQVPQL